jgi:hypothetical protein
MFSPTKNPCVVKTTPLKGTKRFRYDPYKATVLAPSVLTPEKPTSPMSFAATPLPAFYNTMFAPYPVALTSAYPQYVMPTTAATTISQASSCEVTPAPSMVPSRVTTPAPMIAVAPAPVVVDTILSSSTSSNPLIDDGAASVKSSEATKHYAIVKFKHDTYPYEAPFRVAVGDYVIVEGDRGESIGTVKEITMEKPSRPVASRIMRRASQKERDLLAQLRRKEQHATKFCENAVKDLSIDMSIVDTEYQFDQNKLSIYFKSKGMVDFRRLQRVLFREFRCRVWLVNWNELICDA